MGTDLTAIAATFVRERTEAVLGLQGEAGVHSNRPRGSWFSRVPRVMWLLGKLGLLLNLGH